MIHTYVPRRLTVVLAMVVAATALPATAAAPGSPGALRAPAGPTAAAAPVFKTLAEPRDDEGGTKDLRDQLEDASRGFLEAEEALQASKKRQKELTSLLREVDSELAQRQAAIAEIVGEAYRNGRLGPMRALLNAGSADGFLDRAATLEVVAAKEDRALAELRATRTSQQQAKQALDLEVRNQQKQLTLMKRRKDQAERALKAAQVGGGAAGAPGGGGGSATAQAARRNSDGSLPNESCGANDPTTSGCITPRTLHALKQAKSDGFRNFVSCFRSGGSGEHPRGRACDFAAQKSGFGGIARGKDRSYGNRLANYFVRNASRLGVLYVIWFERIWLPSSGWRTYTRGRGDPASDHTNHVHLSMR